MLFVGLMSGTSIDGIDCALVEFDEHGFELRAHNHRPYEALMRDEILALARGGADNEIDKLGALDRRLGIEFATSVLDLLKQTGTEPEAITAIGSHGQTVRHRPVGKMPFTLQIGSAADIAEITGITTISNFRIRDIAAGGEGAPLAPAFHHAFFAQPGQRRAILNLGGIANITLLDGTDADSVMGFDTGPANTLLDYWATKHNHGPYDHHGAFGAQGTINNTLLEALLNEPYFMRPPPKSTGPELFSPAWLERRLEGFGHLDPADIQATLVTLTATSIARTCAEHLPALDDIYVCGGGVHNPVLMAALSQALGLAAQNTAMLGLDPDWVEAVAFAWLAQQCLAGTPANLPKVTGASGPRILGTICPA